MASSDREHECHLTQYGFDWGPLKIERLAEIDGRVVVALKTEHEEIQVACSPKGRKLTVYPVKPRA